MAILDGRLRQGYEVFDGRILAERERAQAESNAAGALIYDEEEEGDGSGGSTGAGGGGNQPMTIPGGNGQGGVLAGVQTAGGEGRGTETFPPPEDIPSGLNDDVVARQIREAAMNEPDPELRERLWDEYRRYTGLIED
ncbi:MAG: hypothetical protein WDZ76_14005 [Pseudohongiellaceae bacterium]